MKDSKVSIILACTLIFLILVVCIYNFQKDNNDNNATHEQVYYYKNYTYDDIYKKGVSLFSSGINLLIDENIFEYEKGDSGRVNKYSINNYHDYKKINNFLSMINVFTSSALNNYMNLKSIINYENVYFIKDNVVFSSNTYIGSILELENYQNDIINFKAINYYCDREDYIGILKEAPRCNYTTSETPLSLKDESGILKIADVYELQNIIYK